MPQSVEQLIVLRDNPRILISTLSCIEQAMAAGRPSGPACALPRKTVLTNYPDIAALASLALKKPNYGVVDLSKFYCDSRVLNC